MKQPKEDLTGRVFGKWTVLGYLGSGKWLAKCECGAKQRILGWQLKTGKTVSCGCNRTRHARDFTGERFGRLTVIGLDHRLESGGSYWKCKCDCGKKTVALLANMQAGRTQSCGCLQRDFQQAIRIPDQTGKTFGKLTVLRKDKTATYEKWMCQCSCGKQVSVNGVRLRKGLVTSCGCERSQKRAVTLDNIWQALEKKGYTGLMSKINTGTLLTKKDAAARDRLIKNLHKSPKINQNMLAQVFNVSRERVRQILEGGNHGS